MNKNKIIGFFAVAFLGIALIVGSSFDKANYSVDADGAEIYKINCMACHGATGAGIPGAFPPLEKSDYLADLSKTDAITILLKGKTGEITVNGSIYNSVMVPFPNLNDVEVASVLNYISTNFGNLLDKKYTASDVKKVRAGL